MSMFKRKNDFDAAPALPRWIYIVAPLLLLLIGGIGVLIGIAITQWAQEDRYWAAYREAMQRSTQAAQTAAAGDDRPDLTVDAPEDAQGTGDHTAEQLDEITLPLIQDELAANAALPTTTPPAYSDSAATTAADMTCEVVRRVPPQNAPTRIPSSGMPQANPPRIDPHVATCATKSVANVGDTVRIFAQAIDIGMPKYTLTQTDATGQPIADAAPILTLVGAAETQWQMEYIFTATQPGTIHFSIYAGGEIHYGYPGPAMWGGGYSDIIQITVIGTE